MSNAIKVSSQLTDYLYRGHHISPDSAQALFDILADALQSRPDIVAAISADIADREDTNTKYFNDILARIDQLESTIVTGGIEL